MKNKKISKLLFLSVFVLGCSMLLWNCETEQHALETHGHKIINRVSLTDFKSKISKNNYEEVSKYFSKKYISNQESRTESSNEFTILTENIVMTQKGGNTFFTFQLRKYEANENFYNLILTVNNQEEITNSEIYEYIPSVPFDSSEPAQFVGSVRTYPNNSIDVSTILNNRSNDRCVVDAVGSWECSFGNNHEPGECNGTSFTYVIRLIYGPCSTSPEIVDVEDGGGGSNGNGPFDPPTGGGGNSNNDDPPSDDDSTDTSPINEETAMDRILECMNVMSITGPNISMPQSLIDSLNSNRFCQFPLDDFIQDEGCSFENKSFAIDAARACLNGDDVDYEEKIINELTGEEKCIYDKLKNLDLFKRTIKKFEDSESYHLTLERGNCSNTDLACTNGNDIENGKITITFEIGVNTLPLEFAAIILHEGIHAELFKYVDEHTQGLDPNERENLLFYYFEAKKILEPQFVDAYAQHQHMADNYVKPIAEAIRTLDNNSYPLEYYMGYGWDGLRKYGYDGYWDNGNWVDLDKSTSTTYYQNQKTVNDNTNIQSNDCN